VLAERSTSKRSSAHAAMPARARALAAGTPIVHPRRAPLVRFVTELYEVLFFAYSFRVDEPGTPRNTWSGARSTATIFIVFATLWFIAGVVFVYLTYEDGRSFGASSTDVAIVFEIVATFLGSAFLAFFGFVLDLLAGIWDLLAGIWEVLANRDE
jgi:hypothetical protein